jgi:hypothetical protein
MLDETERTADRMEAAKWLSDRAFGKAVQQIDPNIEGPRTTKFAIGHCGNKWALPGRPHDTRNHSQEGVDAEVSEGI